MGQMTIFDYEQPEIKPKEIGPKCLKCKYRFFKHGKEEGLSCDRADGCEFTPWQTCRTCEHMSRSVYGLMEYHGFACFGFGISKSQDIEKKACEDYVPATDGETWRTDDKAVEEWLKGEG